MKFLKTVLFFSLALLFIACGGGDSSSNFKVEVDRYSVSENEQRSEVRGYVVVEVDGMVGGSTWEEITLDNFRLESNCEIKNYGFEKSNVRFVNNSSEDIELYAIFEDSCDENYINFKARVKKKVFPIENPTNVIYSEYEILETLYIKSIEDSKYGVEFIDFPSTMLSNSTYQFRYETLLGGALVDAKEIDYITLTSSNPNSLKISTEQISGFSEKLTLYDSSSNIYIQSLDAGSSTLDIEVNFKNSLSYRVVASIDAEVIYPTYSNYSINLVDFQNSMKNSSEYNFVCEVLDEKGGVIESEEIDFITITSSNQEFLKFRDSSSEYHSKITLSEAKSSINLKTYDRVGDVRVEVVVSFKDSNTPLTYVTYTTIGDSNLNPPKLISLNYIDTTYSESEALFRDRYIVRVSDENSNPTLDGYKIESGVISNIKIDTLDRNEPMGEFNSTTFSLNSISIDNITASDTLVVFPNYQTQGENIEFLGAFDILSIDSRDNSLLLNRGYQLNKRVYYIIGDNQRVNRCDNSIETLKVYPKNGESSLVDGELELILEYSPYMVGKDIVIYANIENSSELNGVARKRTLKGVGLYSKNQTLSCSTFNCNQYNSLYSTPDYKFLAQYVNLSSYSYSCSENCDIGEASIGSIENCEGVSYIEMSSFSEDGATFKIELTPIIEEE